MLKPSPRSYTAEFKNSAVELALRSSNIETVAKELGIPKPTLYT
jgi:transposase-like protein